MLGSRNMKEVRRSMDINLVRNARASRGKKNRRLQDITNAFGARTSLLLDTNIFCILSPCILTFYQLTDWSAEHSDRREILIRICRLPCSRTVRLARHCRQPIRRRHHRTPHTESATNTSPRCDGGRCRGIDDRPGTASTYEHQLCGAEAQHVRALILCSTRI